MRKPDSKGNLKNYYWLTISESEEYSSLVEDSNLSYLFIFVITYLYKNPRLDSMEKTDIMKCEINL